MKYNKYVEIVIIKNVSYRYLAWPRIKLESIALRNQPQELYMNSDDNDSEKHFPDVLHKKVVNEDEFYRHAFCI